MKQPTVQTKAPSTFGELFRALEKVYRVSIITRRIVGPDGRALNQRYIVHTMNDPQYGGELPLEHFISVKTDSERMPPQAGASICRNLRINPADFGYR